MGKPGSIVGRLATVNIGILLWHEPLETFRGSCVNSQICLAISELIKKFMTCDAYHFDFEIKEYSAMRL